MGQDRCTRVTRRFPLPKERRGLDRDMWKQRTRIKNCYGRSFYSFTMGSDVNWQHYAKLYAHIGMIYRTTRDASHHAAAPISDTYRFSLSISLYLALSHSVLFVRKTWKKSAPIRVIQWRKREGEAWRSGECADSPLKCIAREIYLADKT